MDLPSTNPHVVVPVRVDPTGKRGPTKRQASGPEWRRTSRGLHVPAYVDGSQPRQRIAEAASVLPVYGGVTGWASLHWAGGTWFDGLGLGGTTQRPVTLAVAGNDIRPQAGIQISAERLRPQDLTELEGLRTTILVRAVCFEMRYAPNERLAVLPLDMAAFDDLLSIDEQRAYQAEHNGWIGIPQGRLASDLADENSWSPRETLMRLVWMFDAGLPRPLCNRAVFDFDGNHIGTPDLFDPAAGVVGEYDGALHLEGAHRSRDLTREEDFRSHGLEYVTMLAGDSRDPRPFVKRLMSAYSRALHTSQARRTWTLEQPTWWVDTSTVERRRALTQDQRERWLRRGAA